MTNVIFCHIISSNFFYRKRDYDKCYDQHKVTRKRDRETGLNTLKYDVINNAPMTINDIPFTVINVKLKCDKSLTPWCDCQGAPASEKGKRPQVRLHYLVLTA